MQNLAESYVPSIPSPRRSAVLFGRRKARESALKNVADLAKGATLCFSVAGEGGISDGTVRFREHAEGFVLMRLTSPSLAARIFMS